AAFLVRASTRLLQNCAQHSLLPSVVQVPAEVPSNPWRLLKPGRARFGPQKVQKPEDVPDQPEALRQMALSSSPQAARAQFLDLAEFQILRLASRSQQARPTPVRKLARQQR